MSAPHTFPLLAGQSVPMRAWWRHWNIVTTDQQQQQQGQGQQLNAATQSDPQLPLSPRQQQQHLPHGHERDQEVHTMMAAGWEDVVIKDWKVSLQVS